MDTKGPDIKYFIALSCIVHAIAAWFSTGWHHPDEHYQLIEFTYAISGEKNAANLPMEYAAAMRPSIQVWLTYVVIKNSEFFRLTNPFVISFVLRLLTAILCIFASLQLHRILSFKNTNQQRAHLLLLLFGWCMVYTHVRYSSETWSAALFALALPLLYQRKNWFIGGLLLGVSFAFRFQMGFAIAGVGIYLIWQRISFKNMLLLIAGGLLSVGFSTLLDVLYYDKWVFTPYQYFYENIVNKVAAGFGVSPWYWYVAQTFEQLIPPFSLLVIAGVALLVMKPEYRMIGMAVLFFIIGHSAVGHKELRFIFPMLFFAPLAAIQAWQWVFDLLNTTTSKKIWTWVARIFIPVNAVALLIVMFKPANELGNVYKFLYRLPAGSTLYYSKQNPYLSGANEATFYKMQDLNVTHLSAFSIGANTYVIKEDATPPEIPGASFTKVYTSIPEWMHVFNFNNWISRTNNYTVYQVTGSSAE
jgi:phosphatidylinositol glycan class B